MLPPVKPTIVYLGYLLVRSWPAALLLQLQQWAFAYLSDKSDLVSRHQPTRQQLLRRPIRDSADRAELRATQLQRRSAFIFPFADFARYSSLPKMVHDGTSYSQLFFVAEMCPFFSLVLPGYSYDNLLSTLLGQHHTHLSVGPLPASPLITRGASCQPLYAIEHFRRRSRSSSPGPSRDNRST